MFILDKLFNQGLRDPDGEPKTVVSTYEIDEESMSVTSSIKKALETMRTGGLVEKSSPKDKSEMVIDCGKSKYLPFVMAFIFTRHGVKRFCGSWDNIERDTKHFPLCHGIMHIYNYGKVQRKWWNIFGNMSDSATKSGKRYCISLRHIRSGSDVSCSLRELIGIPKQTRYYLTVYDSIKKDYDVLASWRKLPSTYIKEFKEIEEKYRE